VGITPTPAVLVDIYKQYLCEDADLALSLMCVLIGVIIVCTLALIMSHFFSRT